MTSSCSVDAAKAAVAAASTLAAHAESRHPQAGTTSTRACPSRSTRQPGLLRLRMKTFRSRGLRKTAEEERTPGLKPVDWRSARGPEGPLFHGDARSCG